MTKEVKEQLAEHYQELMSIREKMRLLQKSIEPEPIQDYLLETNQGHQALSGFFGGKKYLYVVHNMGTTCPYCTLWADGFNGVIQHIESHVAWLVTSPDSPAVQAEFAKSRQWQFTMASLGTSGLAKDLGYEFENGEYMPGVTVVQRNEDGSLAKVSDSPFGPGDPYCAVFNLFDLMPDTQDEWQPQFSY